MLKQISLTISPYNRGKYTIRFGKDQCVITEPEIRTPDIVFTPEEIALFLAKKLKLEPFVRVLEPSAGVGSLALAVREMAPTSRITLVEMHSEFIPKLRARGFSDIREGNFLNFRLNEGEPKFDRISMNPPFSKSQVITHVKHAYPLLATRGKLACILPNYYMPKFNLDSKPDSRARKEFLSWLRNLRDKGEAAINAYGLDSSEFGVHASHSLGVLEIEKLK